MKKKIFRVNIKALLLVYLCVAVIGGVVLGVARYVGQTKVEPKITSTPQTLPKAEKPAEIIIKPSATIDVPFTVQAPLNNWNVHEESCEEAGILMTHYYLDNIKVPNGMIPKETANTELISMKNWQINHYGKEPDLTIPALGQFAKDYSGYNFEVKKNITAENIKEAISKGRIVFVPVITHGLQNSMYGRLPSYHVLLIRGYDETGVITNDSGVGNGYGHHYTWDILWQAVDQQTTKMSQGRDMVEIYK